jgi:hypothetical protein
MAAITSAQSGNWSATTTWTGGVVPIEGDTVTIQNGHTVTIDDAAAEPLIVGADTTTAAINVAAGGKLQILSTATVNHTLRMKGNLYNSGTIEFGTVANPIPSTRTITVQLNYSASLADGEFGFISNTGSTLTIQGASMTTDRCKLNTDEAVGQTVLGVDTNTGWKANDEIAIANTESRSVVQSEKGILSVDASPTELTITSGLTYAHSGTSPTQAEVINLTRNIKITAYNTNYESYVYFSTTATIDIDWCEFSYMAANATNKRGIEIATTTGSCNIQNCAIHDFTGADSHFFYLLGTFLNNVTISNNVCWYSKNSNSLRITNATSGTAITINNNIFMYAYREIALADIGITFTNNTIIDNGFSTNGILVFNEANAVLGTFSGNIIHNCRSYGIRFQSAMRDSIISSTTIWRNNLEGIYFETACRNVTIDTAILFGNVNSNIRFNTCNGRIIFKNITSNGDSTFSTTNGITIQNNIILVDVSLLNCNFSTVSGIKTAHTNDINIQLNSYVSIIANNCKFGATTEILDNGMISGSFIKSQKHDQTAGNHKSWFKYGIISIDTTIKDGATGASQRLTPNNATNKLESGSKKVAVASGNTVTVSVKVRESVVGDGADYNGSRARLLVKRNETMGITADTVLATATIASEGAFETIQGTTIAVTDDGVLEFVVDVDGTAGWVNLDSWTTS